MAEVQAVKVERSRARGHVASNTLTLWPGVIKSRARFCLGPQQEARPNKSIPVAKNPLLLTVRFFEASASEGSEVGKKFTDFLMGITKGDFRRLK